MKIRWTEGIMMGGITCALALATAGCADREENHRWLSVFFDGVPSKEDPPARKGGSPRKEALPQAAQVVTNVLVGQAIQLPADSVAHLHPPFANRQCDACHQSKFSQRLKLRGRELCFGCHEDFLKGAKFIHAPVEAGNCTDCHSPHQSENPFMLLRKGQAICFECHDRTDVTKQAAHQGMGGEVCVTCHDPHRGMREFFLKEGKGEDKTEKPSAPPSPK